MQIDVRFGNPDAGALQIVVAPVARFVDIGTPGFFSLAHVFPACCLCFSASVIVQAQHLLRSCRCHDLSSAFLECLFLTNTTTLPWLDQQGSLPVESAAWDCNLQGSANK